MNTRNSLRQRRYRKPQIDPRLQQADNSGVPAMHFTPVDHEKHADSTQNSNAFHVAQAAQPSNVYRFLQNLRTGVPLFAMDCLGLAFCVIAASLLTSALFASSPVWLGLGLKLLNNGAVFVLIFTLLGLYPGVGLNPIVELKYLMLGTLTSGAILLVFSPVLGSPSPAQYHFITVLVLLGLVMTPLARCAARGLFSNFDWWCQPALVVGERESSSQLLRVLEQKRAYGLRPIGFVHSSTSPLSGSEGAPPSLGNLHDLASLANQHKVFWALIALGDQQESRISATLQNCSTIPNIVVIPGFEEFPSLWNRTQDFGGVMGICLRERLLDPWSQYCKRLFDMTAVILGTLLFSPVLVPMILATWICMKIYSPGPLFYGQERVGKDGNHFLAWKFRTMVVNAEAALEDYLNAHPEKRIEWDKNQKLRDDPRIIPGIGDLLRKSSLDELPQLWNVLLGEMSLVGPRPFMTEQTVIYGDRMSLYRKVRPGITGLWQISGRNHTTFKERSNFDAYYVRNWSFWLDIFILGRTVRTVLFREGAF